MDYWPGAVLVAAPANFIRIIQFLENMTMYESRTIVSALLLCFITGCAVTGPADDGFENSLESVDIGTLQDGDLLSNLARKAAKAANAQSNTLD